MCVHGGPTAGGPFAATLLGVVVLRLGDAGAEMSPCGLARRHASRGAMAILAWKFPRTRLPVGASALCIVILCWLYVFPVYRLPDEKEIVQGVRQQGTAWRRNQTAARVFRYLRLRDSLLVTWGTGREPASHSFPISFGSLVLPLSTPDPGDFIRIPQPHPLEIRRHLLCMR